MGKHEIKVGDVVSVNFNGSRMTLTHKAEVFRVPCATGDSWIFRALSDNSIHYVSEGCTVSLRCQDKKGGVRDEKIG